MLILIYLKIVMEYCELYFCFLFVDNILSKLLLFRQSTHILVES